MRALLIAVIAAATIFSSAAYAKDNKVAESPPNQPLAQAYSAEVTAAGVVSRRKADEQQRAWEKKTKGVMRGICTGC
jgi:hypothetical protein